MGRATHRGEARAVMEGYLKYNREQAGDEPLDLLLLLGDNAYLAGTDAQWQGAFFDVYGDLLHRVATWPTIGNHEMGVDAGRRVRAVPGARLRQGSGEDAARRHQRVGRSAQLRQRRRRARRGRLAVPEYLRAARGRRNGRRAQRHRAVLLLRPRQRARGQPGFADLEPRPGAARGDARVAGRRPFREPAGLDRGGVPPPAVLEGHEPRFGPSSRPRSTCARPSARCSRRTAWTWSTAVTRTPTSVRGTCTGISAWRTVSMPRKHAELDALGQAGAGAGRRALRGS